jgi:uracil-DNA glycosylase
MDVKIEPSWKAALKAEFAKEYFKQLSAEVKASYLLQEPPIYPPAPLVYNAFNVTPLTEVKVVILGQDPYHGPNQAHGLSFSVQDGVRIPPSLQNIYKEIHADIGTDIPASGNLERWAEQGVLLLNTTPISW